MIYCVKIGFHSAQSFNVLSIASGNLCGDELDDDSEVVGRKGFGDDEQSLSSDWLPKSSTARDGCWEGCRWPEQVANTDPDACSVVDETASP